KGKVEASGGGGSLLAGRARLGPLDRDVDPREAILKYADAAAADPYWITPAYKATQPVAVLAPKVLEDDELDRVIDESEEDRQQARKRRKMGEAL
ncbi:hypothetical protein BC828DRAFT_408624, partial [Blastocladiella britannica]